MDDNHLISLAGQLLATAGMLMEDRSPELISVPTDLEHALLLVTKLDDHASRCRDLAAGARALLNIRATPAINPE